MKSVSRWIMNLRLGLKEAARNISFDMCYDTGMKCNPDKGECTFELTAPIVEVKPVNPFTFALAPKQVGKADFTVIYKRDGKEYKATCKVEVWKEPEVTGIQLSEKTV
jgi:hypothetical protein